MLQRGLTEERIVGMGTSRWNGLIGVIAADAVLILLAVLFLYFPKVLPLPNLQVIPMTLWLVAVVLTIAGFGLIGGWIGVVAADAVLILLAALFLYFPKALPMPNLDIISMVLALVAVALTILGFGVIGLNKSVDQNTG
jgi:hypothetical protein